MTLALSDLVSRRGKRSKVQPSGRVAALSSLGGFSQLSSPEATSDTILLFLPGGKE